MSHRDIFTPQYADSSGPGSTPEATEGYRKFLGNFIAEHDIYSIVDFGCGDLEVMSRVDIPWHKGYLGVDVIPERIWANRKLHPQFSFAIGDALTYPIPPFDLLIAKDVLQHWCNAEVTAFLTKLFTSQVKMALITNDNYNDPTQGPPPNTDCATGSWRPLDLTAPPFSIGKVVYSWSCQRGEHLDVKDVVLIKIRENQ